MRGSSPNTFIECYTYDKPSILTLKVAVENVFAYNSEFKENQA